MRKTILLTIAALLVGCAPKSGIIKDGRFNDPAYEYSVALPDGWEVRKYLPISIPDITYDRVAAGRLLAWNEQTQGVITVSVEKSYLDYELTVNDPWATRRHLEKFMGNHRTMVEARVGKDAITAWDYQIYHVEPYRMGFAPMLRFDACVDGYEIEQMQYIYPCAGDDTCNIIIQSTRPVGTSAANHPIFIKLRDSLEFYDPKGAQ